VYLNAPALVSAALVEPLRAEPEIRDIVRLWDEAKMALVGVGAWPKPDPSYAAAGFPVDDPALADAVGDVAGWSFTIEGQVVRHQGDRVLLGVTPDQLRAIPNVICFAGSVSKAQAAIGAARAGLINVLVTDATTARAMDSFLDAEASA
jgi:DNA-binding transcriptional regulator LsrR (DeoR family)